MLQAFLCEEGAVKPIAHTVRQGLHLPAIISLWKQCVHGWLDKDNRGMAVHVLWNLIRQNKNMLNPNRNMLGCEGTALIEPLLSVIGWGKKSNPEAEPEAETDEQDEDYSDEALLILKALAEQDEEVREKVGDLVDSGTSRCAIM